MSPDEDRFTSYRSDVLFLLIGSNPLPNYVAARLLARPRASIYLLHTQATDRVAERLAVRLGTECPDLSLVRFGIPEADGPAIARKVEDIVRSRLSPSERAIVGLNYTSGTKPMAVYAALALRQSLVRTLFSYLDARSLTLIVDGGEGAASAIAVGDSVALSLKDVAELHGFRIVRSMSEPCHPGIAAAICDVHLAPGGMKKWREWLETWCGGATLPQETAYPELRQAIRAFEEVCGGTSSGAGVAAALGFSELSQCGKYFAGGWLEDVTLGALSRVEGDVHLTDRAAGLEINSPGRPNFELDAAATLGYQLFGISCAATEKKDRAKEHLMEVYVRAGQLGGDEARYASVTLCDDRLVRDMEREVSEAWDAAGKIRIFGRSQLPSLSQHLLRWFREANQEVP